jgi:hypothetical protein
MNCPSPLLSEAQVESFRRDGYASIPALTDAAEIATLLVSCDEIFGRSRDFQAGDRIELIRADGTQALPQIVNPERYAPGLVQGMAYRNAQAIAHQLLGADFKPAGNHAIVKPARIGGETPWHQDEAYWDPRYAHEAVSIWLALQPVTIENGCMQFVPGSHRGEVLPHVLVDAASHGLRLREPTPVLRSVACELPAGGAVVHAARTLHYAGPNRTDTARRAVVFGFGCEPRRLANPRTFSWQRPEWFAADR